MYFRFKKILQMTVSAALVVQPTISQANVVVDLPNPDDMSEESFMPELPEEKVEAIEQAIEYKANATLVAIPRTVGGTVFKVTFKKPISLSRVSIKVAQSKVKIHRANAIEKNGRTVELIALETLEVLNTGESLSHVLNEVNQATGLEFLMESYGADATVEVAAISTEGTPQLENSVVTVLAKPTTKAKERKPEPPQKPDRLESSLCYEGICVGQIYRHLQNDYVRVKVQSLQANGTFTLQFLEGRLYGKVGDGWGARDLAKIEGCSGGVCVGERYRHIKNDYSQVKVVGLQSDGTFILEYLEGRLYGRLGGGWDAGSLAKISGCSKGVCTGEIYRLDRDGYDRVKIVGIQSDGTFVVEFQEGRLYSRVGGGWETKNLAKTKGCLDGICVGETYRNIKNDNVRVEVVGIQPDGKFILEFQEGRLYGARGGGWSSWDLKKNR